MNERPTTSGGSALRAWLPLAAVAAAATVLDLTKAVHIDDTAYLEIARWIIGHPLHPMMGTMNWGNTADPISTVSQPHLLFYLMAGVMRLVPGAVELAMHVVWVAMSAATVFLFHALARALDVRRPLFWTALLCLGPAFIPSQNLMVDVPLLGVWLACILMLVRADAPGESAHAGRRLLLAAALAGVACLIKYTSLALLPIVALAIWWRGERRWLAVLLVPLGVLAAWSLFNWFDYGGVHLLARPVTSAKAPGLGATLGLIAGRMGLWLIALGAIVPGALAFAPSLGRTRAGRVVVFACAAIAAITIVVGRLALGAEPAVQSTLRGLFVGNGVFAAALAVRAYWQARTAPHARVLAAWALGAASFIVLLSLFIAVRHALVALPAIVLLVARGRDAEALSPRAARFAVGLTTLVGVAVGLSDRELAGVYRDAAPRLGAAYCSGGVRCVTTGHWGWQWYSARAGLVAYDSEHTVLRAGDRMIVPELVSRQTLRPADAARLVPLAEVEIPASPLTIVRTIATETSRAQGNRSGGYYYFWTSVPWTLTTRPLERFRIYDVR
jgi:Dolichyl-phosphate-mannose-protein mannosyltransferase